MKNKNFIDYYNIGNEKLGKNFWTGYFIYKEYHKKRYKYYLSILPKDKDIKILDIGTSLFTLLLKEAWYNNITSIDLTDNWKKISKENNIDFYKFNILKDDFKVLNKKYDLIIFNEILEHLYMPFCSIVDKLSNFLNDNWEIIIGTPNFSSLDKRLKVLFWFNSTPLFIEKNLEQYHVREYTLKELKVLFDEYWYSIKEYQYPLYFDYPNKTNSKLLFFYRILLFPIKLIIPSLRKAIYIKISKKNNKYNSNSFK